MSGALLVVRWLMIHPDVPFAVKWIEDSAINRLKGCIVPCQMAGEMMMKIQALIRRNRKRGRGCPGCTPDRQHQQQPQQAHPSLTQERQNTSRRRKWTEVGQMTLRTTISRMKTSVRQTSDTAWVRMPHVEVPS